MTKQIQGVSECKALHREQWDIYIKCKEAKLKIKNKMVNTWKSIIMNAVKAYIS